MTGRIHIVLGAEENYEDLKELAGKKKTYMWWACDKTTKKGESLLFYFRSPISKIVAMGVAASDAKPHKDWRFIADIEDIKMAEPPVALKEMRERIPGWGWAERPRKPICVPEHVVNKLLDLINLKRKESYEKIISSAAAGFGTPEKNRVVEKAACKAVRHHFKRQGFKIVSREKENLGYDFDASRGKEELHVEVKGISGLMAKFIITANEVRRARADLQFRVAAVCEALTPRRKIEIFTGAEFLKKFGLTPLAYFAEMKQEVLA